MHIARKKDKRILLNLAFLDQKQWTGGKARSVQLLEIFKQQGFELEDAAAFSSYPGKMVLIYWAIRALFRFGVYRPLSVNGIRSIGWNYYKYTHYVLAHPAINVYVLEGTGFGDLQAVEILKYFKKKVILIPANIESLAPYPNAWTHQIPVLQRLESEVKYYLMADAIFCISSEETWLLQILSANVFFLPYYPPAASMKDIEERRVMRLDSQKKGWFYFADFRNSPNRLGFESLIRAIRTGQFELKEKLRVAGIGIEQIRHLVPQEVDIELLGELSQSDLQQELINCKLVVLHHHPTSGMLTRIPELLLSGIPVIGNLAALKAYALLPDGCDVMAAFEQLVLAGVRALLTEIE